MRTLEMKIEIPEVKGARCVSTKMKDGYILVLEFEIEEDAEKNGTFSISESELECRIDPNTFEGEWMKHQPTTRRQKETLNLYQEAKAKGRLHAFTCMTIDPSIKDEKVVYQKGLPPAIGFSQKKWAKMLKDYNPSRNSRQMTRTEYVCRNLFLIQKLVESGYEIEDAWTAVCVDSTKIGHYLFSDNAKEDFEPTGSREICGFCDLANAFKFLSEDSWDEADGFLAAGGSYNLTSCLCPVAALHRNNNFVGNVNNYGVGMLALD